MNFSTTLPEIAPALIATRHGPADVLEVQDLPVDRPGPGQVLIRVEAAGVNFIDVYQREGIYPTEPPFVVGNEGAGQVVAVGESVTDFVVGDRVAWPGGLGSARRYATIATTDLVSVPAEVSLEVAAAAMLQGLTAHYLTTSTYAVTSGTTALVHAAAGGVGQLLTQLIVSLGGRVIATAGSAEKVQTARERGAAVAINYRDVSDLAAAVKEVNNGDGVDVVYDGVGRDTFDASLAALKPRGLMVLYGASSGQVAPFDLQRLNTGGSLFVTRPTLASYLSTRSELLERAGELFSRIQDQSLTIAIGARYPLTEARAAYDDLESRRTQGKLLLLP